MIEDYPSILHALALTPSLIDGLLVDYFVCKSEMWQESVCRP
jgi:hypothetical protein